MAITTNPPLRPTRDEIDNETSSTIQRNLLSRSGKIASQLREEQVAMRARALEGNDLKEYLKNALDTNLKLQLGESLVLRRQSVREMKMIVNELKRGNLRLTEQQKQTFLGMYQRAIHDSVTSNSILARTVTDMADSVKHNIPSIDTVLSAITVSNPVVGFGLKLVKDTITASKQREKERKEEVRHLMENLETESKKLDIEMSAAEEDERRIEAESPVESIRDLGTSVIESNEKNIETIESQNIDDEIWFKKIHSEMKEVKENTHKLLEKDFVRPLIGDSIQHEITIEPNDVNVIQEQQPQQSEQIRIDLQQPQQSEQIRIEEQQIQEMVDSNDSLERVNESMQDLIRLAEEQNLENDYRRMSEIEQRRETQRTQSNDISRRIEETNEDSVIFDEMGNKVKTMFSGLLSLTRFIPHAMIIGTVVAGAKRLFDGFNDAANILDKPENQIDMSDRISAAVGTLIGGFGGIIDYIANSFGFNTNFSEEWTKSSAKLIANFYDRINDWAVDMWEDIFGIFSTFDQKATEFVDSLKSNLSGQAKKILPDSIFNFFFGDSETKKQDTINQTGNKEESTAITSLTGEDKTRRIEYSVDSLSVPTGMNADDVRLIVESVNGGGVFAPTNNSVVNAPSSNFYTTPPTPRNQERTLDILNRRNFALSH